MTHEERVQKMKATVESYYPTDNSPAIVKSCIEMVCRVLEDAGYRLVEDTIAEVSSYQADHYGEED